MNPFEQSTQQLLRFLTSHAEWEVIDYIRQEMQREAPSSIPTEEELLTFFQSPDEATTLNAYQQMLATDKLLEYAEISLRTLCDLIRYQQLKELGIVHVALPAVCLRIGEVDILRHLYVHAVYSDDIGDDFATFASNAPIVAFFLPFFHDS